METILKYFSDFTEEQIFQFKKLEELYTEWNSQINVISRKDIGSLYDKHVLHSLAIAAAIDFRPGTKVVDIGTGGGFPGIPLAIFFPEVQFTLVDSVAKKLKVVTAVAEGINLKNVQVVLARAETLPKNSFDFVVSRAVAPIGELWHWAKPLLKKKNSNEIPNSLICLKGGDLSKEIYESGLRPKKIDIQSIFPLPVFEEKFILIVENK